MSKTKRTLNGSLLPAAFVQPEKTSNPFEVSHSKIKLARRCLKAYDYKYLQKLAKRVKSRPLIVGSLVHSCIEMYFREGYYLPAIQEWKDGEFRKMFAEEQALHADVIPLTKSLIRGYISNWKSSGYSMIWVEKEFRVEIYPGLFLVGKIDGKCSEGKRFTWLVEHKTAKRMPGEEMRIFDTQVVLYDAVLELLGEEPVTGVMWDYLRTKLPAKPELLARGGLSQSMKIDTTPEVYLREIHRHGLDPRGYQPILQHLEEKRDQFYRQVKLPINKQTGLEVLQDVISTSMLLIALTQIKEKNPEALNPFTRNLTRDCSWCDYSPLCHAELRGEDTSYMKKHDYIVRSKDAGKETIIEVDPE